MTMQRHETITKPSTPRDDPNLADYDATRASFDWAEVEKEIDGLPGGGLNLAYEAIDRHVAHGNGAKPAMLWEGKNGEKETYTYDDMRRETNKFANVLGALGVEKGTRVFTFMERVPEIYFTVFGTLKAGCVIGPSSPPSAPTPSATAWRTAARRCSSPSPTCGRRSRRYSRSSRTSSTSSSSTRTAAQPSPSPQATSTTTP